MGGTAATDAEEVLVAALVARARSTFVGSHVPQMEPKLNEPLLVLLLPLLLPLPSCRMEAENALKQHRQRGLLVVEFIMTQGYLTTNSGMAMVVLCQHKF